LTSPSNLSNNSVIQKCLPTTTSSINEKKITPPGERTTGAKYLIAVKDKIRNKKALPGTFSCCRPGAQRIRM